LASIPGRVAWLLLASSLCATARGQVQAQVSSQTASQVTSQVTISSAGQPVSTEPVPGLNALFRGFNAGVTFSQVHDSSAGWYHVVTPAVSYAISEHYSVDASASIYPYRRAGNPNPATEAADPLVS
jgi:hypothetical protein